MPVTDQTPRIAPVEPPYEPNIAAMLAKWMPPRAEVEPLRLFRTLIVHEELAGRMRPLGAGILGRKATVPPALREVMIHRTCALTGAEYEWGVHVMAFARPLGFTDEQIESTLNGSWQDACWDAEQSAVFRLADELHGTSTVSGALWEALAAHLDETQVLELIVTAGWYHVIAYVCNGLRIEHEEWAASFPR